MKKFFLMLLAMMLAFTSLSVFAEDETIIPSPGADAIAEDVMLEGFVMDVQDEFILVQTRDGLMVEALLNEWGLVPQRITPLGDAKHIFTHLEWHMTGYEILLDDEATAPEEAFFAPSADLDHLFAIPSAYRAYRPFM